MPKRASKHALPPPLPIVNAKIRSTHVMSQRYELCTLLQVGQPKRPRQQIADLSVLYAQASFLNEHFQLKVLNWSGPHDAVVGRLFKGNAAPLGCPQHAQIHTHTQSHTHTHNLLAAVTTMHPTTCPPSAVHAPIHVQTYSGCRDMRALCTSNAWRMHCCTPGWANDSYPRAWPFLDRCTTRPSRGAGGRSKNCSGLTAATVGG